MNRNKLEGLWIPRKDIEDWEVNIGGAVYRRSAPGPVSSCRVQLDSIGCLTSGSITLKKPGSIPRPFEQQVLVSVKSRSRGWIPVCLGCLPPAKPDAPQEWTLELQPGEVRDMDGYFDGSLVGYVAGVDGAEANVWTETNRAVVDRVLKANPSASIGVDWEGEVILATPESGSPVYVSRAHFYDWKMQPEVVLPYATESRWDGGKGWAKGEYTGRPRPPCTPRKAVDAGQVEFKNTVSAAGPPLLYQRELIHNLEGEEGFIERDVTWETSKPLTSKVTASQYALVSVYDLQTWFEQSALAAQDFEEITKLEGEVKTNQGAYDLALETLGPDDPVTQQAATDLADAQNQLRLSKRYNRDIQSGYEPLSALLSYGFVGMDLGDGVVTGCTMWISTQPWDEYAVGPPLDPDEHNPDPGRPLGGAIEGVEGGSIAHPFASPNTLLVGQSALMELTQVSEGQPWQTGDVAVPESYFRSPLSAALARSMDEMWRQRYDPDPPPEDEKPPSASWGGRWYFHVAAWWSAVQPAASA